VLREKRNTQTIVWSDVISVSELSDYTLLDSLANG